MKTETLTQCGIVLFLALSSMLSSCGGMSRKEKDFVGSYYVPVISETTAAMELHKDGTSLLRAEIPGEINVEVPGKWHIHEGNLVIDNEAEHIKVNGDRRLLGRIAEKIVRPIKYYDKSRLVLVDRGLELAYRRR